MAESTAATETPARRPPGRRAWLRLGAPAWILLAAAIVFSLLFIAGAVQMQGVFNTSAFDLAIYDQAFWQYSRLLPAFNTILGLHMLGDHFSPIALLYAPLYRLWPDIGWALALQTLSVSVGGIFLFLIARHLLPRRPWIALAVGLAYYLHPAVHNTLLWQYHDLVLASGLYLGLIWSYLKDRFRLYLILLLLLLACREDMPFTLAAFGVLALIERRRRFGVTAILLSVAWWLLVSGVVMPWFNGVGYIRHTHGTLAKLFAHWSEPAFYLERIRDPATQLYLWQVAFPAGLIGLFSPRYLLPALPTLAANVLIGGYNTGLRFHYSVSVMPFVFWSALATMQRFEAAALRREKLHGWSVPTVAVLLLAGTGWSSALYSRMDPRQLPDRYQEWQAAAPQRALLEDLDRQFGSDGVAATDYLVPHLSHRQNIYLLPNPWETAYWGIANQRPHHPNQVKYVVLGRDDLEEQRALYDYLTGSGLFETMTDAHDIIVLRRVKAEPQDRAAAMENYRPWRALDPPAFVRISLSPAFATPEADFRRLDVDLAALQRGPIADATHLPDLKRRDVLDIELGEAGKSDFMTRYVRTELHVREPVQANLEVGSDDGVTVWVNGRQVHEMIVSRQANLGDDHIAFPLSPGANVVVFRVNNGTGAWRLLARIRIHRCPGDCSTAAAVRQ